MNRWENITSGLSVRIKYGHLIRHDSRWEEQKTKQDYTLWSIVRGKVWITVADRIYPAESRDAVLFYPGCSYSACTDQEGCEFIFLYFTLEIGSGLEMFAGGNVEGVAKGAEIHRASQRFQKLFQRMFTMAQHVPLKLYAAFLEYLCEMIRTMEEGGGDHFPIHAGTIENPFIRRTLDYISASRPGALSVRQLAAAVNLSEKHFISSFKNVTGISPGQYINQLRMREAAELVCNTDRKISEIALLLGYSDAYSFSKAFKRAFGEAPTDFRKNVIL